MLASTAVSPPNPAPAVVNASKNTVAELGLKAGSFQITAEPNQTLREISVRYLGVWDQKRLREIQALNPQLTDLDHLRVGQKIWLPAPEPTPVAQPSTGQGNPSRAAGAGLNASVTPVSTAAAIRNPVGGMRGSAEPPRKVVGSTGIGNGAESGLNAKERSGVTPTGLPTAKGTAGAGSYGKVAPAGIPSAVKGAIPVKTAVAPVPAEMLSRPTLSSNPAEQNMPNCGGITDIPCPTLQVRTKEHQD
ncbi:MAG: hypothetical protein ACLQG3_11470 [Terracidiphilus sp.]